MATQEEIINSADGIAFELNRGSLYGYTAALGFYLINMPDVSHGLRTISEVLMFAGTLITLAGIGLRLRSHIQEVMKGDMPSVPLERIEEEEVSLFKRLPFQNVLMLFTSIALSMRLNQLFIEKL